MLYSPPHSLSMSSFYSPAGHSTARGHDIAHPDCLGSHALAKRSAQGPHSRLCLLLRHLANGHGDCPAVSHLYDLRRTRGKYTPCMVGCYITNYATCAASLPFLSILVLFLSLSPNCCCCTCPDQREVIRPLKHSAAPLDARNCRLWQSVYRFHMAPRTRISYVFINICQVCPLHAHGICITRSIQYTFFLYLATIQF